MLHSALVPRHGVLQPGEGLQGGGPQGEDLRVLTLGGLNDVSTELAGLLHPAADGHLVLIAAHEGLHVLEIFPQLRQLSLESLELLINGRINL